MLKVFKTDSAAKIIDGSRSCEWIHLNLGLDIPPVSAGSYKYLLWDILKARADKDILISKYLLESFDIAVQSKCAVCQLDISSKDIKTILNCRFNWLKNKITRKKSDIFIQSSVNIIKKIKCQNVLLWGGINSLPELRKCLSNYNIVYAQRHYSYRRDVSFYDYCDVLLAQTAGQVRYAFEHNERLTPSIYIIPNGVETEKFRPAKSPEEKALCRDRLGIPQESTVVVFPSKVALHKGSRLLERIIIKSQKKLPSVFFLVIGGLHHNIPEYHRRSLEKTLTESANTYWCRGVNREKMPELIRIGDICLMPAVWREGFSMAAIECMASALPIIAPASGSYVELIKDGYNGKLARLEYMFDDLYDAVRFYSMYPRICQEMGGKSREFAVKNLKREYVIKNFCHFLEGNVEDIKNYISLN